MVVPEKFDDQLLSLLEDILHGIVYQGAESHSLSVKKEVLPGEVKPCTTAESIVYGLTTGNVFFKLIFTVLPENILVTCPVICSII